MPRIIPAAVLLATVGAAPPGASGFALKRTPAGDTVHWPDGLVRFTVNRRGSADVPDTSDLDAVRRAFSTWRDAPGAALDVVFEGPTGSDEYGYDRKHPEDNDNLVVWLEDDWPFEPEVLAVTLTVYELESGELVDADIVFNGADFHWTASAEPRTHDIENSATHEVGHLLGLGHAVEVPGATMHPDTAVGETSKRSLHADDVAALRALYAAEGTAPGRGAAAAAGKPTGSTLPPAGDTATDGRPAGGEEDGVGGAGITSSDGEPVVLAAGCSTAGPVGADPSKTGQSWLFALLTVCAIALRGEQETRRPHRSRTRRKLQ